MKFESGEKTIKIFRKHWLVMFFELLLFVVIAIAPALVLWITWRSIEIELVYPIGMVITLLFGVLILLLWIGFFIVYTNYFLDVWILTNQRVVDIDQKNLFVREISTIRIEKIQDVTVDISGLFPSIFGYGNISIQSAGAEKEFVIRNAKNPNHVKELILQQQMHTAEKAQPVTIV